MSKHVFGGNYTEKLNLMIVVNAKKVFIHEFKWSYFFIL
jgi:hypothetical protein